MPFDRRTHGAGVTAVLLAAVLLSTGGVFIKAVSIDALGLSMWRSLLAGLTIWLVLRPPFPARPSPQLVGIAASYAGMLLFLVIATRLTTAANAIFLQFTAPLYVAVLARVFLGERATSLDIATLAVAFAGMALFFVERVEGASPAGNVFGVAAGLCFACMLVLFRTPGVSGELRVQGVIAGNLALALALVPVNLARGPADAFAPAPADFAGLVFMGVVQIGLGYVALTYGVARVDALEAALVNMIEPVLNPAWVWLFLGENPGGLAILGGAIIVAAIGVRTWLTERRPRTVQWVGVPP